MEVRQQLTMSTQALSRLKGKMSLDSIVLRLKCAYESVFAGQELLSTLFFTEKGGGDGKFLAKENTNKIHNQLFWTRVRSLPCLISKSLMLLRHE